MDQNRDKIVGLLKTKATLKQDIADYAERVFELFRVVLKSEVEFYQSQIEDDRVRLRVEEKGTHELRLFIGSDAIIFQLHRNIFKLPEDNPMWKTSYLKENEGNGFFGMINVYNFLAESFEQNRMNDPGYLLGRVFMNHQEHFMVEGKGQLGFLFRDLANSMISEDIVRKIVQVVIAHAVDFDLVTPPYEMVQQASVMQIESISSNLQVATGKRLGFRFSSEENQIF